MHAVRWPKCPYDLRGKTTIFIQSDICAACFALRHAKIATIPTDTSTNLPASYIVISPPISDIELLDQDAF
jgi:hypothetical protein